MAKTPEATQTEVLKYSVTIKTVSDMLCSATAPLGSAWQR